MTDGDYYWFRPPREGRASTFYATRHASGRICEQGEQAVIDIEDRDFKQKSRPSTPWCTSTASARRRRCRTTLGERSSLLLREEAARTLQIYDINDFVKRTVWPYCVNGGGLEARRVLRGDDFIPSHVSHSDIEDAVFPSCFDETKGSVPNCYAWEDNDKKHEQNREVCTHGVTLLDANNSFRRRSRPCRCPS